MVAAGGHWSCAISVLDQTVAIIQSAVDVDDYCVLVGVTVGFAIGW